MDFEWDETKNQSNREKHGVDFEIVHSFDWVEAIAYVDDRQDYGEERLIAFGEVLGIGPHVVVFTIRTGRYRIISVRPFGRKDQQFYDELKRR